MTMASELRTEAIATCHRSACNFSGWVANQASSPREQCTHSATGHKQQSVSELTENKNLDSDMMGTIFELAYAAFRAAKITIPDGIGAWAGKLSASTD